MGLLETYFSIRDYHDYETGPYQLQKHEAIEVIAALKKQVPKKAWIEAEGEKTISGICPVCERELVYIKHEHSRYVSFCPECGQRIDWKGEMR